MKEDLTENPQKGELNFGEKFNIEQCPENDHLFCTAISFILFLISIFHIMNQVSLFPAQFWKLHLHILQFLLEDFFQSVPNDSNHPLTGSDG